MNSWDFSSSRLKIKRSKTHLKELSSRLDEWRESDSFRVFIDKNPDTGNKFIQFTCTEAIPNNIPVIIGDIVHNLRSALDFIAIEIVNKAGLGLDHVYFPVRDTEADLIAVVTQSKVKMACPQAADVIVNRIKPYKARNHFLWSLNRLSNADKHRLLIPVLSRAEFSKVSLEHDDEIGPRSVNVNVEFSGTEARSGDIVGFNGNHLEIKDHGHPALEILFDERLLTGVPKTPCVLLLDLIGQRIERYIHMFEEI